LEDDFKFVIKLYLIFVALNQHFLIKLKN